VVQASLPQSQRQWVLFHLQSLPGAGTFGVGQGVGVAVGVGVGGGQPPHSSVCPFNSPAQESNQEKVRPVTVPLLSRRQLHMQFSIQPCSTHAEKLDPFAPLHFSLVRAMSHLPSPGVTTQVLKRRQSAILFDLALV
jgi:hypothetical protein